MGKGDRKTAKGKRYNSSYGNARKAVTKATGAVAAPAKKTAKQPAVAKAPAAKKVVAKKAATKE
ncbi:30S ribosomal protein THX [Lysobacter silvisoli]|uniref:30S ribosomal protein THX n=1 Tax=Lysobacter silvisoli TaxID=2293254 RepID=A0A371K1C7_9GAMM|nr:30S ribosomal protein THX [Lysobacter silvisoli]RDZ27729.1 30S ribosomal protein THX [Lysobacter silvisoli]